MHSLIYGDVYASHNDGVSFSAGISDANDLVSVADAASGQMLDLYLIRGQTRELLRDILSVPALAAEAERILTERVEVA